MTAAALSASPGTDRADPSPPTIASSPPGVARHGPHGNRQHPDRGSRATSPGLSDLRVSPAPRGRIERTGGARAVMHGDDDIQRRRRCDGTTALPL